MGAILLFTFFSLFTTFTPTEILITFTPTLEKYHASATKCSLYVKSARHDIRQVSSEDLYCICVLMFTNQKPTHISASFYRQGSYKPHSHIPSILHDMKNDCYSARESKLKCWKWFRIKFSIMTPLI